jgi:RNA polymerase sigma factor (sigma-70 family)
MSVPFQSEQALLEQLAAGNRAATEQVYRQAFPPVCHWVETNGGSEPDAADAFQEAMVVLFGKAQDPLFRLSCAVSTYLFAVSKHIWLKRLQQRSRGPVVLREESGADEGPDWAYEDDVRTHYDREAQYEQLDAALGQLGEPCASLLRAFYHRGQSMQEIAAAAGYTNPDTAKTQKYKCLARLKKLFFGMAAKNWE